MFGRSKRTNSTAGSLDGGTGRGVPMGGSDTRRPGGYDSVDDDHDLEVDDGEGSGFIWEDGDPADRRRDPLRKPGT